jgi:hypothetical protein
LEILEIANLCHVDIEKNPYLLSIIEESLIEFKSQVDETWEFRVTTEGSISSKTIC